MRAAVAQTNPRLGAVEQNREHCLARLSEGAARSCDLLVFPECALTGYMFPNRAEALLAAEEIPGPSTAALEEACAELGMHCIIGMLERDGDVLRNTAVLVGPRGLVGRYRKSHIACVGVDCFTSPGEEEYEVFETSVGRIGMQICYDWRFPEISRVLALRGARQSSQQIFSLLSRKTRGVSSSRSCEA